jgi:hypothetical protein
MKSFLLAIIIQFQLIFLFAGCDNKNSDYRDMYTGVWNFSYSVTEVNIDSMGSFFYSDSLNFLGSIMKGQRNNEIIIQYAPDNSISLEIDENGNIAGFPSNYCSGEFHNQTSLNLYLKWGGLGAYIVHYIEGDIKTFSK